MKMLCVCKQYIILLCVLRPGERMRRPEENLLDKYKYEMQRMTAAMVRWRENPLCEEKYNMLE